jgi:hypothetical protein
MIEPNKMQVMQPIDKQTMYTNIRATKCSTTYPCQYFQTTHISPPKKSSKPFIAHKNLNNKNNNAYNGDSNLYDCPGRGAGRFAN